MKISRIAALTLIAAAGIGGVATAQQLPGRGPVEQGYIAYHYNQEAEPRVLVATAGLNCDGTYYHDPLILGQHIEYVYFDC